MWSLKGIAAMKIAVEMCTTAKSIRFTPPKSSLPGETEIPVNGCKPLIQKKDLRQIAKIVQKLRLSKCLRDILLNDVILITSRIITWIMYHENRIAISNKYLYYFLRSSFFSTKGIIDYKKAAQELMKDRNLGVKQLYLVSCIYCFTDHISDLYCKMIEKEKKELCDGKCPEKNTSSALATFWSYHQVGHIDMYKGRKEMDLVMLKIATIDGSKTAVEYCLESTNLKESKDSLILAAINVSTRMYSDLSRFTGIDREVYSVLNLIADLFRFLFSKMEKDQKEDFLMEDLAFEDYTHSPALEYFLDFPYQNYFMQAAKAMWDFLPLKYYLDLLIKICELIESKGASGQHDEDRFCDYRKLLRDFWCDSPERFKKYIFHDDETNLSRFILFKLYTLKNFTSEDRSNVLLILSSVSSEEKEKMITSEKGVDFCLAMMAKGKWELLDEFVLNCYSTEEEATMFKRAFSITREAQDMCISFVACSNRNEADAFIQWSCLPEEEATRLKVEMFNSEMGKDICQRLLHERKRRSFMRFIKWFIPTEETKDFNKYSECCIN